MEKYLEKINRFLNNSIAESNDEKDILTTAMRYSLMAGGKRIRPVLALAWCDMLGGNVDDAVPAACAVEMIHTYSLIHDDLPCMDNDDMRRGKPTNHKVYGECIATLAGDALQPLAFEMIAESKLAAERKVKCSSVLAKAAGCKGMCRGQTLDMLGEGKELSAQELDEINHHKTGALLAAACMVGAAAAGADDSIIADAEHFGYAVGLAFQIRDDMLDVLSTDEVLGKPVGSDARENKNTYMAVYGEEKCAQYVKKLTDDAVHMLKAKYENSDFLESLACSLVNRLN